MLYLEDYLEMIEHLPQELRDRFTDMREMDLSIHNNMDELEKRVKLFFNECKRYQNDDLPQNLKAEYLAIQQQYYKSLEDADEKVQLANTLYDLVERYVRRLDTELHKFKCELEADNKGITELLEKRSLELDTPSSASNNLSQQKENRYDRHSLSNSFRYQRQRGEKRSRDSSGLLSNQYPESKRQSLAAASSPLVESRHVVSAQSTPINSSNMSYNLGHNLGAGNAIAAAASQAIAATQQMQQGRRTASLKASYEAINTSGHEFIPRELQGAAQTAIQAIQQDHANSRKKQKKCNSFSSSSSSSSSAAAAAAAAAVAASTHQPMVNSSAQSLSAIADLPTAIDMDVGNAEATDGDWTYDPNEPRYCICNQVSYGDMVACDNVDCPSEWFHYACVNITAPPKGKWYCPNCTVTTKRRGGRKN